MQVNDHYTKINVTLNTISHGLLVSIGFSEIYEWYRITNATALWIFLECIKANQFNWSGSAINFPCSLLPWMNKVPLVWWSTCRLIGSIGSLWVWYDEVGLLTFSWFRRVSIYTTWQRVFYYSFLSMTFLLNNRLCAKYIILPNLLHIAHQYKCKLGSYEREFIFLKTHNLTLMHKCRQSGIMHNKHNWPLQNFPIANIVLVLTGPRKLWVAI